MGLHGIPLHDELELAKALDGGSPVDEGFWQAADALAAQSRGRQAALLLRRPRV